MLRALIAAALICVYCGMLPFAAAEILPLTKYSSTQINNIDTTTITNTNETPSTNLADETLDSNNSEEQRYYHPAENKKPRVLEEFNRQYLDGSYEYKYILSNGVSRYEKSYWKYLGGKKLLARKGFYSHPLTNHKFLTVFYTADEHGYVQDSTQYTIAFPTLPKYLDVPQQEFPQETSTIITTTTTTTTQKPKTTRKITTRKPKATATQGPLVKPSTPNWIY